MTVAKLIALLQAQDPHARVVVPHFYTGFVDLVRVTTEPIRRADDADQSMAHARYEGIDLLSESPFAAEESAVVLDYE